MLKRFLLAAALVFTSASQSWADLISYYDFNTLVIGAAAAPGANGVPTSIAATTGAGSLDLSTWTGLVDDFGGSTINSSGGSVAGASLSLVVGTGGNNSFVTFQTNLTGFENATISFATRGTASGFNSGLWSWSTDGTNFTQFGASTATVSTTFAAASVDFSSVAALNNASNAFFRYTLSGGTNATGNNRIDNFQINASAISAVPEPTSMALLTVAGCTGLIAGYRRRKANKTAA